MKFTAVFSLIAFSLLGVAIAADVAGPVAPRDANPAPVSPREVPALLEKAKRSCTPSKCLCNKVEGLFCGNESINPNCLNDDVYQCSTTGSTCVYGYRTSCAKCGKLAC
ncbi:hypothetical protein F5887DRAFT_498333 [Amanita rubescens]|nr:hypothetical protein F5887DRAFT_498333 [Amanita rubescens]